MAVVILMISLTITRNTKNKKHSDNADLEAYDQEAQGRFLSVQGSPIVIDTYLISHVYILTSDVFDTQ